MNVVFKGYYWRKCDSRFAQRFHCNTCKRGYSEQTTKDTYKHKNVRVIPKIHDLIVSGVAQRQIARKLGTTRKTVLRKIKLLSRRAMLSHVKFVRNFKDINKVTFDEMESSERTKCLPLSIPLVVTEKRYIVSVGVARIPAKGPLAQFSRKKYGERPDESRMVISGMLDSLRQYISPCLIMSDSKPSYGPLIAEFFPAAQHRTVLGGRSCVAGQGELKQKGFDPIFELNHTAAMLRDRVPNLKRRSWTNTKLPENLLHIIAVNTWEHNYNIAKKCGDPLPPTIFSSTRKTFSRKIVKHPA